MSNKNKHVCNKHLKFKAFIKVNIQIMNEPLDLKPLPKGNNEYYSINEIDRR